MKPSLGGKSPGFVSKVEIGLPNKKTKWNVEIEWKQTTSVVKGHYYNESWTKVLNIFLSMQCFKLHSF